MSPTTKTSSKIRSISALKAAAPSKKPRIKHVTFSSTATLVVTPRKTEHALNEVWFTPDELLQFKINAGISARFILDTKFALAVSYIGQSTLFAQSAAERGE